MENGKTMSERISVKDRLPEDGSYLCVADVYRYQVVCIKTYAKDLSKVSEEAFAKVFRGGWYDYDSEDGYYECDNVTHWMPLPEPPKEDK